MQISRDQLLVLLDYKCPLCNKPLSSTLIMGCADKKHEFKVLIKIGSELIVEYIYINTEKYNTTLNMNHTTNSKAETLSIFNVEPTLIVKVDPDAILKMSYKQFENKIKTLITFS